MTLTYKPHEYSYDFAGNRTEKKSEGGYTRYLNDISGSLSYVIEEYNVRSEETCHYTWGAELISQERSKNTSYYLCDGHGSVRLLTDESGEITDTYTFDAWGNLLSSTGDTENCFLYCGEQMDAMTGLYYLRARYMNPGTGTFLTMDTYPASIFEPATLHRYLYANANPVSYVDPSGCSVLIGFMEASKIDGMLRAAEVTLNVGIFIALVALAQSLVDQINSRLRIEFYYNNTNSYESVGETTATIEGTLNPPIPGVDIPKTHIPGVDIPGAIKLLLQIASVYGLYECKEAAEEMYRQNRGKGKIVKLTFLGGGYVVADNSRFGNTAISETGIHYGYMDSSHIVHCNVFPEGMPLEIWVNSFHDFTGLPPIVEFYDLPL